MNKLLYDHFLNKPVIKNTLLPHQLSCLDFLLRVAYEQRNNILLYHKMGSGKTILSLLFALYVSSVNEKVLILVPNLSILEIWNKQLSLAIQILPSIKYNLNNIIILTKNSFVSTTHDINNIIINKVKLYDNYFIIVDESHNYFGNTTGLNLIKLGNNVSAVFILLSGSPLTNTVIPIKDIVNILKKDAEFKSSFLRKKGRVFNYELTQEGKDFVKKELSGLISYYTQIDNVPKLKFFGKRIITYPVINCFMSPLQLKIYNVIKKEILNSNEMFSKLLLNASFCTITYDVNFYLNFTEFIKHDKNLLPGLQISKGKLFGEQLVKLDISCKLKYLKENYIDNVVLKKKFVYFSNSTIGSFILRNVLDANGLTEFGNNIGNNYLCIYCKKKRTCKICKPMKYIIITSKETETDMNKINYLLEEYNKEKNDDGKEIMFLFGSKIISEAYTLKEVASIIFLTIPESKSELLQIVSRAIRSFSHKDLNQLILANILIAIDNEENNLIKTLGNSKEITSATITKNLDEFENFISNYSMSFDLKKILYLEIKKEKTQNLLKIFKYLHTNYYSLPHKLILSLVDLENIKRYVYTSPLDYKIYFKNIIDEEDKILNSKLQSKATKYKLSQLSSPELKSPTINKNVDVFDGLIYYNKHIGNCIIKNKFIYPLYLQQNPYVYKISIADIII